MLKSLKKVWYGKKLTDLDYDNINDLLIIAIAWLLLWIII